MNFGKKIIPFLITSSIFTTGVVLCHYALEQEGVYRKVSGIVKTYERIDADDGTWYAKKVEKPFSIPSNTNMLSWDASHYDEIQKHLYNPEKIWIGNFAFFPLFPLLWRITHLSPIGISILNYILFCTGLFLLISCFRPRPPLWMLLLVFCPPMVVIYMIPYSEALFFICVTIGLYGLFHKKHWVYFAGFALGAMTRSAGNILVVAWIIADILAALHNKCSFKQTLCNIGRHLAPIVTGVAAVIIFQHLRGAEHWFQYVIAQGEWGKSLSLPSWPLSDWSRESKSVSHPLIFILTVPALIWLAMTFINGFQNKTPFDERKTVRCLSLLFFIGNVLLALLTQHGCMYSQARLLSCTPFFTFLLLDMATTEQKPFWRYTLATTLTVTFILYLKTFLAIDFLGFTIIILIAVLVFFNRQFDRHVRNTILGATLLLNIFWTAYLLNCFLTNGWIFT